jgi:hypothetical protein
MLNQSTSHPARYIRYRVQATFDPGTRVQRTYPNYREISLPEPDSCETRAEYQSAVRAALKRATGVSLQPDREKLVWSRVRKSRGGLAWVSLHTME